MKPRLPVRQAILDRRTYEPPAEGRYGKIRLDFNENTAGCSAAVLRALAKITPEKFAMYPEYEKPTKRLARYFGVRPSELLLTNGGDDALRVFFDTFVDRGSTVLICEPTFPMYRYWGEIAGARIEALHYGPRFEFPLEGVLSALCKKPRLFFLANPNNPTGTLVPRAALKKIIAAATHTVVILDEAYAEFAGATAIPWLRKYPHLFVARTFSKTAALAGLRLGAALGQTNSIALLRRAMPPFPVNLAALVGAEAAVKDRARLNRYVNTVNRLRSWFAAELNELGVITFPSAGNFLLANFGPTGPSLFQKLERRGILLRDRSHDMGPGFVRITIGTEKEMRLLLKAIQKG
jgi:histidinol-phosphate aminotransferase